MKAKIGGIWIAGCVAMLAGLAAPAYEASRGPTELIHWDPQKAYPGYAFIRTRLSGKDLSTKGPITAFHGEGMPGEGGEMELAEEERDY